MSMAEDARQDALRRAQKASEKDVLDELKRQGVNNLSDLVKDRLEDLRSRGEPSETQEATSTFIYKCFIYHAQD